MCIIVLVFVCKGGFWIFLKIKYQSDHTTEHRVLMSTWYHDKGITNQQVHSTTPSWSPSRVSQALRIVCKENSLSIAIQTTHFPACGLSSRPRSLCPSRCQLATASFPTRLLSLLLEVVCWTFPENHLDVLAWTWWYFVFVLVVYLTTLSQ
jgi:hypothetical protein